MKLSQHYVCQKSFKMKAIIVEDSRLARVELKELLKAHPEIQIIAEAEDARQAISLIDELLPDLIFLDIQLPGQDGFSVLESIEHVPRVIFTTAFDQYAIKSFEYNTLDYLLKPIKKERLTKAINKLASGSTEQAPLVKRQVNSRIFLKDGERCWLVELKDIQLFESCGNYTCVYFDVHNPLVHKSLNKVENQLDPEHFFRVSRQHIVNLKYVKNIEIWVTGNYRLTLQNGKVIDASRSQSSRLKNLLSL